MRKYEQKRVLDALKSQKKGIKLGHFAECQSGAYSIGEYIEQVKGEGTQTVSLLEEYCDILFNASYGDSNKKTLEEQLSQIIRAAEKELKPTRTEMVFLSYKSSMSDSIESIYTAAKDDPNCDTFWIPIPYYELNSDGTFGIMHYEGQDCYKPSIICTDWREYDIEENHPDVIFTFAPYDNLGHATSVHPNYYCKRLRELTDMLVYIPYFVTGDEIGEPFTKCPGVMFSHLVILQSKAVRKCYIRDYKELIKIGYSEEEYGAPDKKFVALGSPKFDAVINAKTNDFILPAEWSKLIEKPDGTHKKTVLYNTSITPSLNKSSLYLEKLQYVLDSFSKRDDIVLWWRPHPLAETALASVYPELAKVYEQIINKFKHENRGIYDNTPDLHRAIARSDAYYGDGGSLTFMYGVTGKPLMAGNSYKIYDEMVFSPGGGIGIINDYFWIPVRRINALLKMNKSKWELDFVGQFPGELDYNRKHNVPLYQKPAVKDNTLYFPPFSADEISTYNTMDNSFKKIKYDKKYSDPLKRIDFNEAVTYGDHIFFIPQFYRAIMRLNTKTNEIDYYSDWVDSLKKRKGYVEDIFFSFPIIVGCSLMLAVCGTNAVVEFDMETCESTIHSVGKTGYRYNGICYDGKYYWLSPRCNTPVVRWDPSSNEVIEFKELYFSEKNKQPFLPCFYYDNYVWLIPFLAPHALKINVDTDEITIAKEFEYKNLNNNDDHIWKYIFAREHDDSIFALHMTGGTMIEYNTKTKESKEEKINYSAEAMSYIEHLTAQALIIEPDEINAAYNTIYSECDELRLKDFMNFIVLCNDSDVENELIAKRAALTRSKIRNADGTSGVAIYEYVKNIIIG